jgi:hypothetical protein
MALAAFLGFTIIGQFLNVMICLMIDSFISPHVGALAFVGIYVLVFWISWKLALYLFDTDKDGAERPPSAVRR